MQVKTLALAALALLSAAAHRDDNWRHHQHRLLPEALNQQSLQQKQQSNSNSTLGQFAGNTSFNLKASHSGTEMNAEAADGAALENRTDETAMEQNQASREYTRANDRGDVLESSQDVSQETKGSQKGSQLSILTDGRTVFGMQTNAGLQNLSLNAAKGANVGSNIINQKLGSLAASSNNFLLKARKLTGLPPAQPAKPDARDTRISDLEKKLAALQKEYDAAVAAAKKAAEKAAQDLSDCKAAKAHAHAHDGKDGKKPAHGNNGNGNNGSNGHAHNGKDGMKPGVGSAFPRRR